MSDRSVCQTRWNAPRVALKSYPVVLVMSMNTMQRWQPRARASTLRVESATQAGTLEMDAFAEFCQASCKKCWC